MINVDLLITQVLYMDENTATHRRTMSRANFNPIFKGRGVPSPTILRSLRVQGGSAALSNKLAVDVDYDKVKLLGAGVITTDQAGAIKSTHWVVMGAVKTIVTPASKIWPEASKDIQVVIRIPDLTIFEFPAMSNMSDWVDRYDLDVRFVNKTDRKSVDFETVAAGSGIREFSARVVIVPGSPTEASLWITVIPYDKAGLRAEVGLAAVNDVSVPHIAVPLIEMEDNAAKTFSSGKAVTATLIQQELPGSNLGMGLLPFIDCTLADSEESGCPDPHAYKEAALKFFRNVHMGFPTTAGKYEATLQKFKESTAPPMKKAPLVFPEYARPPQTTGVSMFS